MGSSGGGARPSFTFDDKQATALQQQNAAQLEQYQLQRQSLLGNQNAATANYFSQVNGLSRDELLRNMSMYTNALGGYQNSLNQNTADANSLMARQQAYYGNVLQGQQAYQNNFATLLGQQNQEQAAQNAAYSQQYLQGLGQYNQDNTAQQQLFMQNYLGQLQQHDQQLKQQQSNYQQQYSNTANQFAQAQQEAAARKAALDQQSKQQGLLSLLNQFGRQRQWASADGVNPLVSNAVRSRMQPQSMYQTQ